MGSGDNFGSKAGKFSMSGSEGIQSRRRNHGEALAAPFSVGNACATRKFGCGPGRRTGKSTKREASNVVYRKSPYTVHTSAGKYWKKLQLWLSHKKGEAVFTEKEARQALFWLKKVNKKLEMRSLRRGALQELSGHATRDIVTCCMS